jgi:hypothetical protein
MEDRKKTLLTLLIPAIAVVLAAVLSAVIPGLLNKETTPELPTAEDVSFMNKLRPLLGENQLINAEYRLFSESKVNKQRAEKVIAKYDDILQRKKALLDLLKAIEPSSYYSRVYQLLVESITSDFKLLSLQKSYIEKLQENSRVMTEVRQEHMLLEQEMQTMTKAEKQTKALPALKKLRERLVQLEIWFERNETERKIVRSNTIAAIRLLNAELREKNLPYKHPNVFEEIDPFDNDTLQHKKNL